MSKNIYFDDRKKVPLRDQWDLSRMYKNTTIWEKEFQKISKEVPKLVRFRGKLKTPKAILESFEAVSATQRVIEKLYVFASHYNAVELSNNESNQLTQKAQLLYNQFGQTISYQAPELSKLPESFLKKLSQDKKFANYKKELHLLIVKKKHILSDAEENILSRAGRLFSGPDSIFSALDNVDLDYGSIEYKGKKTKLTSGLYIKYLENPDRKLRQKVFETYYTAYKSHINTYAEILNLAVKQHDFYAAVKKYPSSLEASLSSNLIDPKVYTTLLEQAHENLKYLYKYLALRAKKLKLKKLNMWDMRVNLFEAKPLQFTYEEAVDLCLEALKPLGEEYVKILGEGLRGGWVDKYENKGKRSGAFSGGCYDSYPYILLNFTGTLNDVFTLAHEAGHSMHSYLARKNQPYNLADYTLFTAEMASTVNERLLTAHLIKKYQGKPELKVIIANEIDAIRATYFRQTMFAEFELNIHQAVEKGEPLTVNYLNETYKKLNEQYHGPVVADDPYIQYEWARIPHFYYNFYVYVYATGIAAAYYFSDQILNPQTGKQAAQKYLAFLASGGNDFPLNQLKKAGLDFTKPPIHQAVAKNLQKCLNLL